MALRHRGRPDLGDRRRPTTENAATRTAFNQESIEARTAFSELRSGACSQSSPAYGAQQNRNCGAYVKP